MSYVIPVQGNQNFSGIRKKKAEFASIHADSITTDKSAGLNTTVSVGNLNVNGSSIQIGVQSSNVGFFGSSGTTQPANIVHAVDAATAIARLNNVIDSLVSLGLIHS